MKRLRFFTLLITVCLVMGACTQASPTPSEVVNNTTPTPVVTPTSVPTPTPVPTPYPWEWDGVLPSYAKPEPHHTYIGYHTFSGWDDVDKSSVEYICIQNTKKWGEEQVIATEIVKLVNEKGKVLCKMFAPSREEGHLELLMKECQRRRIEAERVTSGVRTMIYAYLTFDEIKIMEGCKYSYESDAGVWLTTYPIVRPILEDYCIDPNTGIWYSQGYVSQMLDIDFRE